MLSALFLYSDKSTVFPAQPWMDDGYSLGIQISREPEEWTLCSLKMLENANGEDTAGHSWESAEKVKNCFQNSVLIQKVIAISVHDLFF